MSLRPSHPGCSRARRSATCISTLIGLLACDPGWAEDAPAVPAEPAAPVAAIPAATTPVAQPFTTPLDSAWSWIGEDPNGWAVDRGGLRLRVLKGTLRGKGKAKNLLVRPLPPRAPTDGIAIEVTVDLDAAAKAEQAVLLWYVDDDNYVKVCKEFYGKRLIAVADEQQGRFSIRRMHPDEAPTATLRLVGRGNQVTAQTRATAADSWQTLSVIDFKSPGEAKVGLVSHCETGATERWSTFRDFRIVSLPP